MITEVQIKNFKSIVDLTLPLSNINVFIGENGCGKSNILEAIGFASLADHVIDNESLSSKGIRNAKPNLIFNSFKEKKKQKAISLSLKSKLSTVNYTFEVSSSASEMFPIWVQVKENFRDEIKLKNIIRTHILQVQKEQNKGVIQESSGKIVELVFNELKSNPDFDFDDLENQLKLSDYLEQFLIYAPATLSLRGLQVESQKQPLGIYGENIDVLLASFSKEENKVLERYYYLIDWLEDLLIDRSDTFKLEGYKLGRSNSKLYFKDKFMGKGNNLFSAENANEGVLHILFYLSLFLSKRTPSFLGIDNIETALNPKLCRNLIKVLSEIAIEKGKQALITTHNPAILDGLNLHDDRQRLFVVKRNDEGHTQVERIKLKPQTNGEQLKLSEMWMRGYLGGLPTNF